MSVDLYKQQSAMLHEWIKTSTLEEKKRPGKKKLVYSLADTITYMYMYIL